MFVTTWSGRTVNFLDQCTNSQSLYASVRINFQTRWQKNWCMLWHWHTTLYLLTSSTCFLCSRSPAAQWLLWSHDFKIGAQSVLKNCLAYCSIPSDIRTQDWLLWRYLNLNHQSSCRFEKLQFQSLVKSWHDRWELLVISNFWEFLGSEFSVLRKRKTVSIHHRLMSNFLFFNRSGEHFLFGSFSNQRSVILCEL